MKCRCMPRDFMDGNTINDSFRFRQWDIRDASDEVW